MLIPKGLDSQVWVFHSSKPSRRRTDIAERVNGAGRYLHEATRPRLDRFAVDHEFEQAVQNIKCLIVIGMPVRRRTRPRCRQRLDKAISPTRVEAVSMKAKKIAKEMIGIGLQG